MSKKKKIIIGIVAVIVAAAAVVTAVIVIRTKSGSGDSKVSVYADKVSDVMYRSEETRLNSSHPPESRMPSSA